VQLSLKVAFWVCSGALIYNLIGYPVVLFCARVLLQIKSDMRFLWMRRTRRKASEENYATSVAIIISAYNEESVIETRINNIFDSDYSPSLMEVLIGLDGSTDSTAKVLSRFESPYLRVFNFPVRRGKLAVISELAKVTSAEILVFTDANTMFTRDCVRNLVRHFNDPAVGVVSGEEIRVTARGTDPAAEGIYWRYESGLKILESTLGLLHSANGGVYAIRRSLFQPQPDLIVEDFQIPLELRFRGNRIIYDPEAISVEEIAPTFASKFERRVRLAAGNFQTLLTRLEYLSPVRRLAFAYYSHRVLRWVGPGLLILGFICNMALISAAFYRELFIVQSAFYGMALIGLWREKGGRSVGFCRVPFHFCSMNLALIFGLCRFLGGRQTVAWTATPRTGMSASFSARPVSERNKF